MSEETRKKLEELEEEFLKIKAKLKDNPDAEYFVQDVIKAIKICNEYKNIQNENTIITKFSITGKSKQEEYLENQLIFNLYVEISRIDRFDFLKDNNINAANTTYLYNFFNSIQIEKPFKNYYITLLGTEEMNNNFLSTLYEVYLKKDILLMYELKNDVQREYYHCTNCKNYEDFIKKHETITEIAKQSQKLAERYKKTSLICFGLAFAWFAICEFFNFSGFSLQINDNRILMHFFENQIYQKEIFIFLSKLLFKLPSFVLCLVGVKFLYLFVQYKTEERELSMLDNYLERIPNDCKQEKAELIKQLASHFFQDKKAIKISQGFLQELMLKFMDKK